MGLLTHKDLIKRRIAMNNFINTMKSKPFLMICTKCKTSAVVSKYKIDTTTVPSYFCHSHFQKGCKPDDIWITHVGSEEYYDKVKECTTLEVDEEFRDSFENG